ncbi:MAG: peroxiredoxin [Haloarculaceae archaeon]
MVLEPGDSAPDVRAPNQDGEPVEPDWTGVSVVYFYPEDDTPGCTTEAEQFQAELDSYRRASVTVYGVSVDDVDSHAEFADAYGIEFDLLADPDGEVVNAFDVEWSRGAAKRTTFVVVGGRVQAVYEGVDPDGHARNVLADLVETDVVDLD